MARHAKIFLLKHRKKICNKIKNFLKTFSFFKKRSFFVFIKKIKKISKNASKKV